MSKGLGRAQALMTLQEWTKGESLRKHAMAVSVCVESYGRMEAERLGLSGAEAEVLVEKYACAGLLHDMDYERHPTKEEHPFVGVGRMRELVRAPQPRGICGSGGTERSLSETAQGCNDHNAGPHVVQRVPS